MYRYDEREPYYLELLTNFGLKSQEAKVYLAALRLGQSTVSQIAKEANIERTNVYVILDDLQKRGIVSLLEIHGKKHYRAISIENFNFLVRERFERFQGFLPELKGLEKSLPGQNIRFFEGRAGIIAILQDTLNQPGGSEGLCYVNVAGFWTKEKELGDWYIKERVKRNIRLRMIAPDNRETMEYVKRDKKQKRETCVVPTELFPFVAEIDIYGNKVAIISLRGKELIGIIIESEAIAQTQRMIFELAWRGATKTK